MLVLNRHSSRHSAQKKYFQGKIWPGQSIFIFISCFVNVREILTSLLGFLNFYYTFSITLYYIPYLVPKEPLKVQLFYRLDERIIISDVIATHVVSSQSECLRLCLRTGQCAAYSLDKDGACTVGSSDEESFSNGEGVTYFKL